MAKRKLRKRNTWIALVILMAFFAAMNNATGEIRETNTPPEVYFCPADNCAGVLEDILYSANASIHCAMYDIDLPGITGALREKKIDIDARLVTDKDRAHPEDIGHTENEGTWQLMHNKFCVIDGRTVVTGSFNPTVSGRENDNNMIVIYSDYVAGNYEDEFRELESGAFGGGAKTRHPVILLNGAKVENYFCPEDGCAGHVIEALRSAEKSIEFMAFSFTHDEIGDVIAEKHGQGVAVRGVFEKFQNSRWSEYEKLRGAGADVRWDSNPKNMHNKVFIVDGKTVITGSFNPTSAGDTKNDENIVIIHDEKIAKMYASEFERIYG